jgi:hypothetical protein
MAENAPSDRTDLDAASETRLVCDSAAMSEASAVVPIEAMRAWLSIVAKGEFDAFGRDHPDR